MTLDDDIKKQAERLARALGIEAARQQRDDQLRRQYDAIRERERKLKDMQAYSVTVKKEEVHKQPPPRQGLTLEDIARATAPAFWRNDRYDHHEEDPAIVISQAAKEVVPIPFLTPAEIVARLSEHVIGQDGAKRAIAVAAHYHYQKFAGDHDDENPIGKSNICLLGPTGSGKTLLLSTLAKILNVPFVTVDATELTPDGYVGTDIGGFVDRIEEGPGQDPERAIVFIDEIDKIAFGRSHGMFKSGEIQQALLKIVEGKPTKGAHRSRSPFDREESRELDTTDMLFVIGGAFSGLTGPGFEEESIPPEYLVAYGLMPEFVGRFPVIACLQDLDEGALLRIMKEPKNSLLEQYARLFKMHGCQLAFEPEALDRVAAEAYTLGTGARGLRSILERVLQASLFRIPTDRIDRLVVSLDMVEARLGRLN